MGGGQITGIDHVQVAAPRGCEREARAFYGGLLGLPEIEKPGSLARRGGVWFTVGGEQLHVGVEAEFSPARKAHPAFRVATSGRLDEVAARLVAAGSAVRWDDGLPGFARFYVDDPWGNRIELLAPLERGGA